MGSPGVSRAAGSRGTKSRQRQPYREEWSSRGYTLTRTTKNRSLNCETFRSRLSFVVSYKPRVTGPNLLLSLSKTPKSYQDRVQTNPPSKKHPKRTTITRREKREMRTGGKKRGGYPMITLGGRLRNEKGKSGDLEKGPKKKAGNKDLQLHALSQASGFRFMLLAV